MLARFLRGVRVFVASQQRGFEYAYELLRFASSHAIERASRGAASCPIILIAKLWNRDARSETSHTPDTSPEQCVGELPFEVTRPAIEASLQSAAAQRMRAGC